MAKQTLKNPFLEMDKKNDMNQMKVIEKKAGKPAAMKFQAEDEKDDKKLVNKGKKEGKSDSQIMKLDEKKDRKLMSKIIKSVKKP